MAKLHELQAVLRAPLDRRRFVGSSKHKVFPLLTGLCCLSIFPPISRGASLTRSGECWSAARSLALPALICLKSLAASAVFARAYVRL